MTNLTTDYLGMELSAPLVVSSIPLSADLGNLKRMEDAGAGAVVLESLFEEQIELEAQAPGGADGELLPPGLRYLREHPQFSRGAAGYLAHLHAAKEALDIPVIASLNGSSRGGWLRYAGLLEQAGADALELNLYYIPTDLSTSGAQIESRFIDLVAAVSASVGIPVAVKLSPYFSSIPHMVARLVDAGARGIVMFNRFYQPDFDVDARTVTSTLALSDPTELRQRLRWAAILHGRIAADIAITGGVHSGLDAAKCLLAGAQVAMLASALMANGIEHIAVVRSGMAEWLERHLFDEVADARGHLSYGNGVGAAAYERASYISELKSYRPASRAD